MTNNMLKETKNIRKNILRKYREYIEKYKEIHKEYKKDYYKKYYEKKKEETTCVCGSTIQKIVMKIHEKSKKHINYINDLSRCAETI